VAARRKLCCPRRLDDTEAGVPCALLLALDMQRHSLGLGFLQVGVLATQMHVLDPDQRPVRLVHLLLYEAAQFLDEFGKMSQTPLHSLPQHLSELIGLICWFATRSNTARIVRPVSLRYD